MNLNKLTELLTVEQGTEAPDGQGGLETTWAETTPLWGHVVQRLRPRTASWEGGQEQCEVCYEVWVDAAVTFPDRFRLRWQGGTFYPLHDPILQVGGLWQMVTLRTGPHHD